MDKFDRKQGIGCSELSTCIGMNPWMTALKLWAIKTGAIEEPNLSDKEHVEIGSEIEEWIAGKFERRMKMKVRREPKVFRHPKYPYIYGHVDRIVLGEDAILECKNVGHFMGEEWKDGKLPQNYVCQLTGYLGLTKRKYGYFAALVGGNRFLSPKIEFDKELYDKLIDSAVDFWERFVIPKVPPMAVAMDNDGDTLDLLFPKSGENILKIDGKPAEILNRLIEERQGGVEQAKIVEKELNNIEAQIKQMIGENEALETGTYRASWKSQSKEYANQEKMKEDGLWEKYRKESVFRVLRTRKIEPTKKEKK